MAEGTAVKADTAQVGQQRWKETPLGKKVIAMLVVFAAVAGAVTVSGCTPADTYRIQRELVAAKARSQIGTPGMCNKYSNWYANGQYACMDWCAMFVSWVYADALKAKYGVNTAWGFHSVPDGARELWNRGRISTTPRVGDLAFVGHPGGHVGIVVDVYYRDGRTVVGTIEGNLTENGQNGVFPKLRYQGKGPEDVMFYGRLIA